MSVRNPSPRTIIFDTNTNLEPIHLCIGNRYYRIERRATYQQLKQLRKLPIFRLGKYKGGLITNRKTQRELPYRELAARTIGYENKTEKGDRSMRLANGF